MDADREMVEAVRVVLKELPPTPADPRAVEQLRERTRAALATHRDRLDFLLARYMPEAHVPPFCSPHGGVLTPAAPWLNVIRCVDLCPGCRGEAARALDHLMGALEGKGAREPFLPPEVASARIMAGSRAAEARRVSEARPLREGPGPVAAAILEGIKAKASASAPLGDVARCALQVLQELPDGQCLTAKDLARAIIARSRKGPQPLHASERQIHKTVSKALRPFGLKNKRGAGYYLEGARREKGGS